MHMTTKACGRENLRLHNNKDFDAMAPIIKLRL